MTTVRPLSKTRATKEARVHLRLGHFVGKVGTAYVFCPRCRTKVDAVNLPWETPAPALRAALIDHLLDTHKEDA